MGVAAAETERDGVGILMAAVFIDAEDREALWDFQVPKDVDAVQWLTDVLQPDDTLHMVKTLLTKRNIPRSCYEQLVAYVVQRQQEVSKAKAKVRVTAFKGRVGIPEGPRRRRPR